MLETLLNNLKEKYLRTSLNTDFDVSLNKEEATVLFGYLCESNYANYSDIYKDIINSNQDNFCFKFFKSGDLSLI